MEQESARRDGVRNGWRKHPPRHPRKQSAPRKIRADVLASDPVCYICMKAPATEVDHHIPKCLGGSDDRANLRGICRPCHLSKSSLEANHIRWHVLKVPHTKQGGKANG